LLVEYKRLDPNTLDKLVKDAVAFETDAFSRPERLSIERFRSDVVDAKMVLKFDSDVPNMLSLLFSANTEELSNVKIELAWSLMLESSTFERFVV
jgi:hypothetical protein